MSNKTETSLLSLSNILEALLFVAPEPISIRELASVLDSTPSKIEKGLQDLSKDLENRGLRLQWHGKLVQLTTSPDIAGFVEKMMGLETTSRLTSAALEALSIVAYRQPVTRPQIDAIRGVNSDGVMKGLLNKGLIHEVGRADSPGRPILFSTTPAFLQWFGLNTIAELPPLDVDEVDSDIN